MVEYFWISYGTYCNNCPSIGMVQIFYTKSDFEAMKDELE